MKASPASRISGAFATGVGPCRPDRYHPARWAASAASAGSTPARWRRGGLVASSPNNGSGAGLSEKMQTLERPSLAASASATVRVAPPS